MKHKIAGDALRNSDLPCSSSSLSASAAPESVLALLTDVNTRASASCIGAISGMGPNTTTRIKSCRTAQYIANPPKLCWQIV